MRAWPWQYACSKPAWSRMESMGRRLNLNTIVPGQKHTPAAAEFWNAPLASVIFASDGLTQQQVEQRRAQYGYNALDAVPRRALALQFIARFGNPLVVMLLVASGIAALTGDAMSFVIISIIVLLSVSLDFVQEYQADRAAERLRLSVAARATVKRDGRRGEIAMAELVHGDIVMLSAGGLVPADARVLAARDFFVNQALLTGEPYPVEKHAGDPVQRSSDIAQVTNAVFMGSSVLSGSATVMVMRTGTATALGAIAGSLTAKAPPTAFERGTRQFGMLIMRLTMLLVLFVLLLNILLARPVLESFLFAVALAVGLTPELLPMVISVTLARGALRMARKHVVVKRLSAIHNLGGMDVLCTDKTGTFTEARIVSNVMSTSTAETTKTCCALPTLTAISSRAQESARRRHTPTRRNRRQRVAQARRSTLRFRTPAGLGTGGERQRTLPGRQRRSGRHFAIIHPVYRCGRRKSFDR